MTYLKLTQHFYREEVRIQFRIRMKLNVKMIEISRTFGQKKDNFPKCDNSSKREFKGRKEKLCFERKTKKSEKDYSKILS